MTGSPPKVFISYSHDTVAHQERVLDLADRLRADGIDAEIDQYNDAPPEGWPRWCERQIEAADVVLMVCTETYHRRVRGEEERGKGLGVVWEAAIIRQLLYDAGALSDKFVPVLYSDASPEQIPTPIKGWSYYVLDTEDGYEGLYRRLTGQPRLPRPELGTIRTLPARERRWSGGTRRAASSSLHLRKMAEGTGRVQLVSGHEEVEMGEKAGQGQSGGVNIGGKVGYVGGDIIGGNKIILGPPKPDLPTLLNRGIQELRAKSYQKATHTLKEVVNTDPSIHTATFHLALALLKGKRPKVLTNDDIQEIDELLSTALIDNPDYGLFHWFRALVRDDYYSSNGLTCPPPPVQDIVSTALSCNTDISEMRALLNALPMPNNMLYRALMKSVD